jgi:hypothetical protein
MKLKTISAEEFDKIFDDGEEDILPFLDLSKAQRLGVTRQSLIKMWIAEKLK